MNELCDGFVAVNCMPKWKEPVVLTKMAINESRADGILEGFLSGFGKSLVESLIIFVVFSVKLGVTKY
jgi:hypothetical protein